MRSSEGTPVDPTSRWYQFRLSYLLYLLTLFAIAAALLRPIVAFEGGWWITTIGALYVAALTVYFGIRIPILVRRLRRGSRKVAARKRELAERMADMRRENIDHRDAS